jgi:DNA-binding LytR/AlgR family response regulator
MNIAIADDLHCDRVVLKKFLERYFSAKCIDISIFEFESGEALLEHFRKDFYQIIFMDIYMDKLSGIDAAREIYAVDKACKIIFLTTSNSFASESYEVKAAYYMIKPLDGQKFESILNSCTENMLESQKKLTVISSHIPIKIAFQDILYVDIISGIVQIHLAKKTINTDGRFYQTISPLLCDKRFIECYKGVAVNMEHILKPLNNEFLLDNGEKLPIRKREKKKIIHLYMKFEFENL